MRFAAVSFDTPMRRSEARAQVDAHAARMDAFVETLNRAAPIGAGRALLSADGLLAGHEVSV